MKVVNVQGAQMPALGFGTAGLHGESARRLVGHALNIGYRHIDTAQSYGNEGEVGDAVCDSPVPRQAIWLTTKVWPNRFREGDLQRSVEESVRRLRTEPDLLVLHWPSSKIPLHETIGALSDARRKGLTRHIGVSNFTVALMMQTLSLTQYQLLANQVEYHPYLTQYKVLCAVRENQMAMIAYSPLGQGRVFRDRILKRIGENYGKGPGQIALRWLIQQDGVAAIPHSSQKSHIKTNIEIFDFELTQTDMQKIFALTSPHGRLNDSFRHSPRWDGLETLSTFSLAHRNINRFVRALSRHTRRLFL